MIKGVCTHHSPVKFSKAYLTQSLAQISIPHFKDISILAYWASEFIPFIGHCHPLALFFTKNQRETHHWCGVSRSNLLSNTSQMINFDYTWCCRLIWWFFNLLLLLNDFCIIAIKIFLCLESVYRHNIKAIKNLSSKAHFI